MCKTARLWLELRRLFGFETEPGDEAICPRWLDKCPEKASGGTSVLGTLTRGRMEEEDQQENIIMIRGFPVSFPKVKLCVWHLGVQNITAVLGRRLHNCREVQKTKPSSCLD